MMIIINKLKNGIIKIRSTQTIDAVLSVDKSGKIKIDDLKITTPGEYEKNKIFVQIFHLGVFLMIIDNVNLFFVGENKSLNEKHLSDLNHIDVLLGFEPEQKLINMIEPSVWADLDKLNKTQKIKIKDNQLSGKDTIELKPE